MRLLLVEDDAELGRRLSNRLRAADFAVELATSRSEAEDWPDVDKMAAIILDLGLPDGDGLDLLRHWRDARVETPILILTARGSWQDKVAGLNAGADDFVVKPVRFEELLARLNALFRRQQGSRSNAIEVGDLRLDPLARIVGQESTTFAQPTGVSPAPSLHAPRRSSDVANRYPQRSLRTRYRARPEYR